MSWRSPISTAATSPIQPGDLMPGTVGKGEAESNLMRRAASNGFVRNS